MGKGPSPLQKDILAVLAEWPAGREGLNLKTWARPRDIIQRLGRAPTPATRTAVSKALGRLWQRELVAVARGEIANVGCSYFYRRSSDKNECSTIPAGR
jgi:hypothetical protein